MFVFTDMTHGHHMVCPGLGVVSRNVLTTHDIVGMITNPQDGVILIELLSLGSYWLKHLKGEDEKDHGRR